MNNFFLLPFLGLEPLSIHAGEDILDATPSVNWSMVGRCTRLLKESDIEDFLLCLEKEQGFQ